MEEDISNYSPTVMFRGTPCILKWKKKKINQNKSIRWKRGRNKKVTEYHLYMIN